MELKAKNKIATATNKGAHEPTSAAIEFCVSIIPSDSPDVYNPEIMIMKAVAEQIIMVSKNTPKLWTSPCLAG